MTTTRTRTCARDGCERTTDWPTDSALVAAFCREHTAELLDTRPEWRRRLPARDETGALR